MNKRRLAEIPQWLITVGRDRGLRIALGSLLSLTIIGTSGYSMIEGMRPFDALYMTVITLSTVGYAEIHPLSDTGRMFTLGLITLGVGAVFQAAGALAGFVIEGRLRELLGRRNMQHSIDLLRDHVILCGYGRLGRAVSQQMGSTPIVVVDMDESVQKDCENAGLFFVHGSALEESVLQDAGIGHARALIAATGSDPDNVFIALSATDLRPDIQIHARAESTAGVRRLGLSGASQVVSPHQLAGQRIANALLRPGVVEFLELSDPGTATEVDLEEVVLAESSKMHGVTIRGLVEHGVTVSVIAIKRGDEPIRMHPSADEVLCGGDHLVAVGDRTNLALLAEVARNA